MKYVKFESVMVNLEVISSFSVTGSKVKFYMQDKEESAFPFQSSEDSKIAFKAIEDFIISDHRLLNIDLMVAKDESIEEDNSDLNEIAAEESVKIK